MLLLDTGVILAAADTNDRAHEACLELLESTTETLVISPLVVAEAGYLIDRQLGSDAESAFYRSIANAARFRRPWASTSGQDRMTSDAASVLSDPQDRRVHLRPLPATPSEAQRIARAAPV